MWRAIKALACRIAPLQGVGERRILVASRGDLALERGVEPVRKLLRDGAEEGEAVRPCREIDLAVELVAKRGNVVLGPSRRGLLELVRDRLECAELYRGDLPGGAGCQLGAELSLGPEQVPYILGSDGRDDEPTSRSELDETFPAQGSSRCPSAA